MRRLSRKINQASFNIVPERFIRPNLQPRIERERRLNRSTIILALILWVIPIAGVASFSVDDTASRLTGETLQVRADLQLELKEDATEALLKGIELTISIDVRLTQSRRWLWNKLLQQWAQSVNLSYHALSNRYVLDRNDGSLETFATLSEAIDSVSRFEADLTVDPSHSSVPSDQLGVTLRVRLDHAGLPGPIKLMASVLPSWRHNSDWTNCPLAVQ